MNVSRLLLVLSCLPVAAGTAEAQEGESPTSNKTTRSYDVSAIVNVPADSAFLVSPQGPLIFHPREWESPPDMPRFGDERAKPDLEEDENGMEEEIGMGDSTEIRAEALIQLLGMRVHGSHWDEFEGVSYREGRLFVHGTPEVHNEAERLVAEYRKIARRLVRVECLLVPPEVLDELAPGWRQTAPSLDETVFTKALVDKRTRLLTAVARNGQKVTAGSKEIPALLAEQEVNQTGVIPVINPIVTVPLAGDRLDIRPFFIPGRDAVLVDLAVGRFRVTSKKAEVGELWGHLDLATKSEALISVTTVMAPGTTYVAAGLDGTNGSVALVRVHPQGTELPGATGPDRSGPLLRRYDVGVLLRTNDIRRWWTGTSAPSLDSDILVELLMETTGGVEAWEDGEDQWIEYFGGQLHVSASKKIHATIRQLLDDEIRRRTQVVVVDLELLDMPREAFARVRAQTDDGFRLGAGWRKALEGVEGVERWSYSLTGLTSESHALRLAELQSLVTGVDNVSGGTGFAIIEVSDPLEDVCGAGREFRLQVDLSGDPDEARLRLEGADAELLEVRSVWCRYPSTSGVLSAEGDSKHPAQRRPQGIGSHVIKEIELSLPRQKVEYWSVERDLPIDQEVLLASGASEGKGARLLVARVRKIR